MAALLGYETSDAVNDDEDEIVQEALKVRSKALEACQDGEERCKRLRREQRDLKAHRKELQRHCDSASTNLRTAEDMAKQRQAAAQALHGEAARAKVALENEISLKSDEFDQTSELSRRLNENLQALIAQHDFSLAENARAKKVLLTFRNVDTFKKTKERECSDVDLTLRRVQAEL